MSSLRKHRDLLAGVWPTATPPSREEIRDELEDHLACSAAEFAAAGLSPAQAEEKARAAFGSVEAVARQLYWLHHGRRIMLQRIILGGLVGVCAILAVAVFVTYRQSSATAGAVATLQTAVGQGAQVDVPVRIVLTAADGTPVANREVYLWPRRIEEPPFVLPHESRLWAVQDRYEQQTQVTMPAAYELLVTDADGVVNLGRRPPGTYTAAVALEPELLAGHWVDTEILARMRHHKYPLAPSWIGYELRTIDVQLGRGPLELPFHLPSLERTTVRLLAGTIDADLGNNGLWLAIRGTSDDTVVWLRGFVNVPSFTAGVAQVDLPFYARATLYMAYFDWWTSHAEGIKLPVTFQTDVPPPTGEGPLEIRLKAGIPPPPGASPRARAATTRPS